MSVGVHNVCFWLKVRDVMGVHGAYCVRCLLCTVPIVLGAYCAQCLLCTAVLFKVLIVLYANAKDFTLKQKGDALRCARYEALFEFANKILNTLYVLGVQRVV